VRLLGHKHYLCFRSQLKVFTTDTTGSFSLGELVFLIPVFFFWESEAIDYASRYSCSINAMTPHPVMVGCVTRIDVFSE